ncbi:alanine acetyltransferase [Cronobacter condimenti 1330]|uniref:Alanine acetyltransferase n=1 Tax=Cronobacter condimenti 1330 TaxID=1073999 RepID=A0ABM5VCV7_9ENTR|nr:GNAT family N-acetyltransferase [Cronobacter condimenti]ALB63027.1 alanine acetyltransferase [Cronobacter condimenti 1330]
MPLQIRQATLVDAALLSALGYRIYRAHFTQMWASASAMNDFLDGEYALSAIERSLKDLSVSWYVAETDRPIGFAKLTWESTIPGTEISGVLLNKLYLDPEETSKRYGQCVFEKITEFARNSGKDFLWLEVLEQNTRAYQFYNKQGMRYMKDTIFKTGSQQSILKIMGITLKARANAPEMPPAP